MNIVSLKNADHYNWGESSSGWHLLKTDTLSVIEEHVPPGEEEVRHYHERAQQFFYVLSGCACIELAGAEYGLGPGEGIHVPPGTAHQLSNRGEGDLRFLVISEPMSHGDRVCL
jgi:mannose-6-phosphate isomerase-like protein (cupin superfamily)